jgi:hypothetical protein
MHSYRNAHAQNNFGEGNVLKAFQRMKNLISVNDGNRRFSPKTTTCHDQQAPFGENEQTYLSITHTEHHISHISDGFIHMIIEVTLSMPLLATSDLFTDTEHICKLFVGFKDSNQIFRQLWIRSRNKGTGYEQSEMCREGFCMGHSMDYNTKKSRKFVHTVYEDVANYNQNVCGIFINEYELLYGKEHKYNIDIIIQFDDLAALQAFSFYPNEVVGDIELSFYTGHDGLVWCPIDHHIVLDVKRHLQNQEIMEWFSATSNAKIDHQFAQINNPLQCIHRIATGADDPLTTNSEAVAAKAALDVAKQAVATAVTALNVAVQALAAAQEALEEDRSDTGLQADVASAETALTNAENALDQKRIEKDAAQEAYDEFAGGIGTTYKRMP